MRRSRPNYMCQRRRRSARCRSTSSRAARARTRSSLRSCTFPQHTSRARQCRPYTPRSRCSWHTMCAQPAPWLPFPAGTGSGPEPDLGTRAPLGRTRTSSVQHWALVLRSTGCMPWRRPQRCSRCCRRRARAPLQGKRRQRGTARRRCCLCCWRSCPTRKPRMWIALRCL